MPLDFNWENDNLWSFHTQVDIYRFRRLLIRTDSRRVESKRDRLAKPTQSMQCSKVLPCHQSYLGLFCCLVEGVKLCNCSVLHFLNSKLLRPLLRHFQRCIEWAQRVLVRTLTVQRIVAHVYRERSVLNERDVRCYGQVIVVQEKFFHLWTTTAQPVGGHIFQQWTVSYGQTQQTFHTGQSLVGHDEQIFQMAQRQRFHVDSVKSIDVQLGYWIGVEIQLRPTETQQSFRRHRRQCIVGQIQGVQLSQRLKSPVVDQFQAVAAQIQTFQRGAVEEIPRSQFDQQIVAQIQALQIWREAEHRLAYVGNSVAAQMQLAKLVEPKRILVDVLDLIFIQPKRFHVRKADKFISP
ncbi:conserved hypothetical protein [Trichinella spiralis]|uniref:hypothetical protein n=1 Tax=Trichinella spiralis TaxID=6334 RepID=UPI0001EFD5F9|nr:conserved hypothetical protein [Trichinella spiralis]